MKRSQLWGAGQCCRATTFRVVCELSWGSLVGAAVLLQSTLRLELLEGFDSSINPCLPVRLLAGLDSGRKGLQFHLFTPKPRCFTLPGHGGTALMDTVLPTLGQICTARAPLPGLGGGREVTQTFLQHRRSCHPSAPVPQPGTSAHRVHVQEELHR